VSYIIDFHEKNLTFATQAGLTALRWLSEGYGYEVTSSDIADAYTHKMSAAANANCVDEA
jgi:hypothetical protein